jgi:hypothetical protein
VPHIDYDSLASLDALIDVSDAAARAVMIRLREQLRGLDIPLDERLVMDGAHRKPAIAFYRHDEPVLHVFPEPNVSTGLHVSLPIRAAERKLIPLHGLAPWVQEAVVRSRPRHNVVWVEATLHTPGRVDDLLPLVQRRLDLLPHVH